MPRSASNRRAAPPESLAVPELPDARSGRGSAARSSPAALEIPAGAAAPVDVELERALEGLFRLGANRRFNLRQAIAVGAVVTRAGYAALRCLHDQGTLSVRGLADACAMDAATASRQLAQLEADGLVERGSADGDARQAQIRLTPHGREVYARVVDYRLDQLTGVLEAWPEADRATLTGLVQRLVSDLARLPRAPRRTGSSPRPRSKVPST